MWLLANITIPQQIAASSSIKDGQFSQLYPHVQDDITQRAPRKYSNGVVSPIYLALSHQDPNPNHPHIAYALVPQISAPSSPRARLFSMLSTRYTFSASEKTQFKSHRLLLATLVFTKAAPQL